MTQPSISRYREFLKDTVRQEIDFSQTDQQRGVPPPQVQKPYPPDAQRIDLPAPAQWQHVQPIGLVDAMASRRSHRMFRDQPMYLDEISFLLWATQGVRQQSGSRVFRTVPSAGCRHAFETYLCAFNIRDLPPAFYRYLPLEHQLLMEFQQEQAAEQLVKAALNQAFVGSGAAVFLWTTVPYRMEWRYGAAAHRVIAMDAGHVCQNLYLACTAVAAGTCAIAAYDQQQMDRLLRVDGSDEFTIYLAPVGKV